ncbi:hypothetical protein EDC14_100320 [Hydrogenispora ethanolica]|jgi:hypothetical protein|uniref:Uncharacterized protein n=1 Tax=Hydrogenispora ethanolica TaxID=1082276 RepID=A0A4R1S886_HYDET|nr:hypothetical protein [Hydrogenispora ethanolica]TCL75090.1 hypothetical protein EDC14_100320 [Hydrogenispora ethanolica]
MKRLFLVLLALLAMTTANAGMIRAEQDYSPIRPQMKVKFRYIIAHMEQKESTWEVTVVKSSFPDSITYTWIRPQKDREAWKGTRILLEMKTSKNFNPWYRNGESKATTDTAPWLSQMILSELREKGRSETFKEGGSGALNWAAADLTVKEKVIFPVLLNGKPEALNALKLNKGITVWNNLNNPLVLEYEPLAIPLFTSVTGWKVTEINY